MILLNSLLSAALIISFIYFSLRRFHVYLLIAQQDEYAGSSLWGWYKDNLAFDRKFTVLSLLLLSLNYLIGYPVLLVLVGIVLTSILALTESNPLTSGKIKLNLTARARRVRALFFVIFVFLLILVAARHSSLGIAYPAIYLFCYLYIIAQLIPFILMLALKILEQPEGRIARSYLQQALTKYQVADPAMQTIGITGSYGKTSVKNYLGSVLQQTAGSTFWPKGGINTIMGISAAINSRFSRWYRYCVIEAGAYRIGSVANVFALFPPEIAVITAIGNQHLERFGSLDVTYAAKTELPRALKKGGTLVCNADSQLAFKAAQEFTNIKTLTYGLRQQELRPLDFQASDLRFSVTGTTFLLSLKDGQSFEIKTKLLGEAAVSNLLAVIAVCKQLEISWELLIPALQNIAPVANRLELVPRPNGFQLNDAYNSNEVGFVSALDVLQQLPGEQKILITPGVIELGEKQLEINRDLAARAEKVCDHIICVGEVNRQAFKQGVSDQAKLHIVDFRWQAFEKLTELDQKDTIVLLENDLMDFHETKFKF